jgi:hypothetical protein
MRVTFGPLARHRATRAAAGLVLAAIVGAAAPARAQYVDLQSFEVSPLVGGQLGGTFIMQPDGRDPVEAGLADAASYGFAAGVRFDDFSLIEFRWMRSMSALRFGPAFGVRGASLDEVRLDQFHADFTREFVIREVKGLRSFITGTLGVTHLGVAQEGFTRFSFGLGAGLKQFVGSRLAIRAEAQWLPIAVAPSVNGFACGTLLVGGCFAVLDTELVQQFQFSIGPVVRF